MRSLLSFKYISTSCLPLFYQMSMFCRKFSIGWFLSSWTLAILFVMILLTQVWRQLISDPKYCRGVHWAQICSVQSYVASLFQIEEDDGTTFRQDHVTGTITRILTKPSKTQAKSFSEKSIVYPIYSVGNTQH